MISISCAALLMLLSGGYLLAHRNDRDERPVSTAGNEGIMLASVLMLVAALVDRAL